MKRWLLIGLVVVSAFSGAVVGSLLTIRQLSVIPSYNSIDRYQNARAMAVAKFDSAHRVPSGLDFERAAKTVTPAVVHIRTVLGLGSFSLNALDSYMNPHAQSSGSGVLITDDGYIVTNHHVIEEASSIEVVMNNNQRFYAKVIGKDPSTDLALLKIKAKNLPFVRYGDSDAIGLGEWVLAIGNPFDLTSTVTAGIVSARARNIGILRDKNNLQIESFIQTDAAVNPGNSGGALVNLKGELIGVNSAIATATGNYSGYSFAIPVSLVRKIVDDLLEYGQVQRGLLGVQIADVTAELAETQKLDVVQGVFIRGVNDGSAAQQAGIKTGDVIVAINEHPVNGVSEMQEWVARHRPGHTIQVTYRRAERSYTVKAILKKIDGTQVMNRIEIAQPEGLVLEDISYTELSRLNLDGGIRVTSVDTDPWKKAGIQPGFVITHLDKVPIEGTRDFYQLIEWKRGAVLLEGIEKDGQKTSYAVDLP
jgi:Do/DeqQ family serine protease